MILHPKERDLDSLVLLMQNDPFNRDCTRLDEIKCDMLEVNIRLEQFGSMSVEEIKLYIAKEKKAIQLALKVPYHDMADKEQFYQLLAVIQCGVMCLYGYYPRDTQLLAVLLSLMSEGGRLLEVATGEGKTVIVAMLAVIKALSGQHVDIITSSSVLAERDAKENASFFEIFGIGSGHNCGQNTVERQKSYAQPIIYGEVGCFQRDFLLDKFYNMNIRGPRPFEVVIVDEVDSMLLDKSQHMLYLSQNIPGLEHLEPLLAFIWCAVNAPDTCDGSEKSRKEVRKIIQTLIEEGEITLPKHLISQNGNEESWVSHRLETWIDSAYTASQQLHRDDVYINEEKRAGSQEVVTIMDKDTGVEMMSTHLSEGVHQMLQFKELKKFRPEGLKSVFVSNITYFKMYGGGSLHGLSGTLGSFHEKDLLKDIYKVDILRVPTFKPSLYRQLDPIIITNTTELHTLEDLENSWISCIVKDAIEHAKDRSVLIINDNINTARKLYQRLQAQLKSSGGQGRPYLYTRSNSKMKTEVVAGDIIVATNLAGRGTDIKVPAGVERCGGLHVILTYCPKNLRIERQAFGRAARKGQRGSGRFVLLATEERCESEGMKLIEKFQYIRDDQEKKRIDQLKQEDIKQTLLEESLLGRMAEVYLLLSKAVKEPCRAVKKLAMDNVLIKWAFWLDRQSKTIRDVKTNEDELRLRATMETALLQQYIRMLESTNDLNAETLIELSALNVLAGKYYENAEEGCNKNHQEAIRYFDKAIQSDSAFAEVAYYYKASSLINSDSNRFREARSCLARAEHLFNQRISAISSLPRMVAEVAKIMSSNGLGKPTDLYSLQVDERIKVYCTHLSAIGKANGSRTVQPFKFKSATIDNEKAEKVLKALMEKTNLLKPMRIFKTRFGEEDPLKVLKLPKEYDHVRSDIEWIVSNSANVKAMSERLKGVLPTREALWDFLKNQNILIGVKLNPGKEGSIGFIDTKKVESAFHNSSLKRRFHDLNDLKEYLMRPILHLSYLSHLSMDTLDNLLAYLEKAGITVVSPEKSQKNSANHSCRDSVNAEGDQESIGYVRLNPAKLTEQCAEYIMSNYSYGVLELLMHPPLEECELYGLLSEQQAVDKLLALLIQRRVLHPAHVDIKQTNIKDEDMRNVLKDIGISNNEVKDITKVIKEMQEDAKGDIRNKKYKEADDGPLMAQLDSILNDLGDDLTYSLNDELEPFRLTGLDEVVKISNQPHWWGPLVVAILGVAQIVLGAILCACGLPNLGAFFISEGVGDIQFAIEAAINGDFSWSTYLEHKMFSVACSILTCGVGAFFSRGVQVAKAGLKTVIKKVLKKCLEAAANALVNIGVDKTMDLAFAELRAKMEAMVDESIQRSMDSMRSRLRVLHRKVGNDQQRVAPCLQKIQNEFFSSAKLETEVCKYVKGVASAVAAGLGRAAKTSKTHGAAFKSIELAAKTSSRLMDAAFILKELGMSLQETDAFVKRAEALVDDEIRMTEAMQGADEVTNDAYIDEAITRWKKLLLDKINDRVRRGIIQPKVNAAAQRLVHSLARYCKEAAKETFGGNILQDDMHVKSLKEVRQQNISALASTHAMFKRAGANQSLPEILRDNEVSFDISQLPKDQEILDGYTKQMLDDMLPGGLMLVRQRGEYIALPPTLVGEAPKEPLVHSLIQNVCGKQFTDKDEHGVFKHFGTECGSGIVGHIFPVVDGQRVNLKPIEGSFCPEQTVIFLRAYHDSDCLSLDPTARMERAKAIAADPRSIVSMRRACIQASTLTMIEDPTLYIAVSNSIHRLGRPPEVPGDSEELVKEYQILKASRDLWHKKYCADLKAGKGNWQQLRGKNHETPHIVSQKLMEVLNDRSKPFGQRWKFDSSRTTDFSFKCEMRKVDGHTPPNFVFHLKVGRPPNKQPAPT